MKYNESYSKLEQILVDLQSEKIPIDKMIHKITEAKKLLNSCQQMLRKTQSELESLFEEELPHQE